MSLGIPGVIVSMKGTKAVMECWGAQREVRCDIGVTILPGDFVIEHDGAIVRLIPPEDVDRTLALYEAVLAEA